MFSEVRKRKHGAVCGIPGTPGNRYRGGNQGGPEDYSGHGTGRNSGSMAFARGGFDVRGAQVPKARSGSHFLFMGMPRRRRKRFAAARGEADRARNRFCQKIRKGECR